MQTMRTQLAVFGGGPAGVCAAIAAAQHGVQTALVTDRPVLGGNSSSEIRVWTRGATGAGNLWAEEMGVWGELKLENLYRNSDANPVFWDETLLDAVLREKNLTLLLNTEIYEVELDGGASRHCAACSRVASGSFILKRTISSTRPATARSAQRQAFRFRSETETMKRLAIPFSITRAGKIIPSPSLHRITPTICHILRRSSAAAGASSTNG